MYRCLNLVSFDIPLGSLLTLVFQTSKVCRFLSFLIDLGSSLILVSLKFKYLKLNNLPNVLGIVSTGIPCRLSTLSNLNLDSAASKENQVHVSVLNTKKERRWCDMVLLNRIFSPLSCTDRWWKFPSSLDSFPS